MAIQAQFLVGNTTPNTGHELTPIKLGLVSNYAVTGDQGNSAHLSNKTAPIDAEELVSIRSEQLDKVKSNLSLLYQPSITKGVQYSVQLEDCLVVTNTDDPSFRADIPVSGTISIRHGKSGVMNNTILATFLSRLVSVLLRDDGTWRFEDLMRSAEKPVVD